MEQVASFLLAIASLAWALFAFTALFLFRPSITQALNRLRRAKGFGLEVELDDLENLAAASVKEVQELPSEKSEAKNEGEQEKIDATVKSILQQAVSAPKVALITLSAELEMQAQRNLATRGLLRGRSFVSLRQALNELRQYGFPPNLQGSLELFSKVRNTIVHGTSATDDDVLRALDSGVIILRALKALPNEVNVVYHPGVEIFSDSACATPIQDAKGLLLETTSPGGVTKTFRIFPTTRTTYRKGQQVAWEWNMQHTWPAAWYRNPETGAIVQAWLGSAEFVGRHLDEIKTRNSHG